jgi:hypothetical protein
VKEGRKEETCSVVGRSQSPEDRVAEAPKADPYGGVGPHPLRPLAVPEVPALLGVEAVRRGAHTPRERKVPPPRVPGAVLPNPGAALPVELLHHLEL